MKLEIKDGHVETRNITTREGKSLTFRNQTGYAHLPGKPYPVEIQIPVQEGSTGIAPGNYEIDLASMLYVDKYKNLSLARNVTLKKAA